MALNSSSLKAVTAVEQYCADAGRGLLLVARCSRGAVLCICGLWALPEILQLLGLSPLFVVWSGLRKFGSLKGWNDHFFWIDASICPIYASWYNDVSVRRDPLPSDNLVDFEQLEKLDNNRTVIRRYPETFLCLVGLSRSFDDPLVRATLLKSDESDMGLLDFVKSVDWFKVKTGERTLAEGEVPLITKTANMVDGGVVISKPVPTNAGKSLAALKRLELQSRPRGNESESTPHPTKEFVSSSVTPTPERNIPEDSGSTQDMNVLGRRPSGRYVVLTSSSEHDDVNTNVSPKVKSLLLHVDVEVKNTENVVARFLMGMGPLLLLAAEREAVEVSELRGYVSELEAEVVARSDEVSKLGVDCESLRGEITGETRLREEFPFLQDAAAQRFEE
nr:putative transposase (putative), gypsy type [Tanacetum cinerariifolium]